MQDFLAIADLSKQEIIALLQLAIQLKKEHASGGNQPILRGKSLAMLFQKPSLRTRVSFEMGMQQLGGYAFYIGPQEIGLGQREAIADIARVMDGYVDGMMARVFDHQHVLELAEWSQKPVINGLSEYNHPCQALSDALTIYEHFQGTLEHKRIAFVGDGNNVAVSLMHVCARLGMDFAMGNPAGYDLPPAAVAQGQALAAESGSRIELLHDAEAAVAGADVVYTDTWTSMGQEDEAQRRAAIFPPFQVNGELLRAAKRSAIVMHCLPAHRGQEITDEVADGPQSMLFPQAHNRLHAQKALLATLLG